MTLSFIIKFTKLVINKRGSRGSLNLSKIRSKNKEVCENAVIRLYGSCMLRVMNSCLRYWRDYYAGVLLWQRNRHARKSRGISIGLVPFFSRLRRKFFSIVGLPEIPMNPGNNLANYAGYQLVNNTFFAFNKLEKLQDGLVGNF